MQQPLGVQPQVQSEQPKEPKGVSKGPNIEIDKMEGEFDGKLLVNVLTSTSTYGGRHKIE